MRWIALYLIFTFSLPYYLHAQQTEIEAPVSKIFVPTGFDDNDQAQVFIYGALPNSCFQLGTPDVVREQNASVFKIRLKAFYQSGIDHVCAQVLKPYVTAVNLGVLQQGVYELIVNPGPNEIKKTISVGKSLNGSPDSFLYADVNNAAIEEDRGGNQLLVIEGQYPLLKRGCARFAENPQIVDDAVDLITVLPVLEYFYDERCDDGAIKFHLKVPLERYIESETLIHVRRVDGLFYIKLYTKA